MFGNSNSQECFIFFFGALGLPGNIETSPLWNKTHKLTLIVMFKPKIIKGVSENFFKHSKKPIWRMWIHHTIGLRKCPEVLITDLLLPVFFFFFLFFRSKREFWSIKIVNFSTWIVPSQKISCDRVIGYWSLHFCSSNAFKNVSKW